MQNASYQKLPVINNRSHDNLAGMNLAVVGGDRCVRLNLRLTLELA